VDQFVDVGTEVTLQYSGGELTGSVRYCCYRDGNYCVGIEFHEGSEWSRKSFHPKHLFDPRRIVPQTLRRSSKYVH
jgi:cbb3-type cytochrome oxidase cytochrome c subunit